MATLEQLHLWPLRVLWFVLALVAAPVVSDALDGRTTATIAVVTVAAWAGWTAALAALLLPRTSSLTVVRLLVPAGAAVAVASVSQTGASVVGVVAVAVASVALVVALAPWTTDAFVDGSSYGPERRLALRTPPAIGALAVAAWAIAAAGASAGPLLLAAQRWAIGLPATVVGAAAVWAAVRSIHQLSRRWLVLVPTGMVVHDPITMPEAQLFLRQTMRRIGPATMDEPTADDGVLEDLTGGASGLAMELVLDEPVALLVNDGARDASPRSVDRVLFTPLRPATFLRAARENRLPVG